MYVPWPRARIRWGRVATLSLLAGMVAACGGCRILALLADPETKPVRADYPHLPGETVCIVVRADMEMLFEYPNLQWEVADHVRAAIEANVQRTTVVEPRRVTEVQRTTPDWEAEDPAHFGKRFDATRLIEITLTEYTTREPDSPHLYRGHIAAAVCVYNTAYTESAPAYRTEVRTIYPKESQGEWGTDDRTVRRATLEEFAQDVARKFYDHRIKA